MSPMPQYAMAGVRMNRVSGATIVSLIPVIIRIRLIATIIDMIMIVPSSSLVA
ncbi:hypothetical protein D3C73_1023840 [compost metagenome]